MYNCNTSNVKSLNNGYKIYYYNIILYFLENYLINALEREIPASSNIGSHLKSDELIVIDNTKKP